MSFILRCASVAVMAASLSAPAWAVQDEEMPSYLVMEPNAEVVFITTGGAEVRADWTAAAKSNLRGWFDTEIADLGYDTMLFDESAEQDAELEQLLLLYEVMSASIDLSMPHKGGGMGSNYDLTLGDSVSLLADAHDTDYAVFIDHYSQIESGGVFMTQVLVGAATGYTPPSQNIRLTAGTVVDLGSGDVVDRNIVFMGDPRDPDESNGIVRRIMNDLVLEAGAAE